MAGEPLMRGNADSWRYRRPRPTCDRPPRHLLDTAAVSVPLALPQRIAAAPALAAAPVGALPSKAAKTQIPDI
jgi:hypothetical protein